MDMPSFLAWAAAAGTVVLVAYAGFTLIAFCFALSVWRRIRASHRAFDEMWSRRVEHPPRQARNRPIRVTRRDA